MTAPETGGGPLLGSRNPKGLGDLSVPLFVCAGQAHPARDFALKNVEALAPWERELVAEMAPALAAADAVPGVLKHCLCRSEDFADRLEPALQARRSGARSVYWEEQGVKFKGCRPVRDGALYPIEHLPFHATRIRRSRIPFGVLRKEGVMRELLAYCFLAKHGMPVHGIPLCVYEYAAEGRTCGYCLVSRTVGETRIEEFIDYPALTVEDVISRVKRPSDDTRRPWGSELNLRGLNVWWYAEEKAKLLATMHFNGGFRGVLNSNIGNDVVVDAEGGKAKLFLCDFDTFGVVQVPEAPTKGFLRHFALHCLVEAVKGSISILDYVEMPDGLPASERGALLAERYFERSGVWRAYERRLFSLANSRGWDTSSLSGAVAEAVKTEAVADVLGECILNSHHLRRLGRSRGVYYPHN